MSKLINDSFAANLLSLWGYIEIKRKRQIFYTVTLMFCVSILEALGIGATLPFLSVLTAPEQLFRYPATQPVIRYFNFTEPGQLLFPVTAAFALLSIINGFARLFLLRAITRLGSAIGADLSISAYRRTLYQPYVVHVMRNSSNAIAGINSKTSEVAGLVILPLLTIVNACLMFILIITTLVTIAAIPAFFAFIGFATMYLFVILFTKEQLRKNGTIISSEQNQIQKALQEGLGGIRDILIDGTQEVYCTIYRNSIKPMRRAIANLQVIGGSPRFIIEAFGMALIAALALMLATGPEGIFSALPLLGVLVLSAQRLLPLLQQCYSSWTQIRSSKATLIDALTFLNQPLPDYVDSSSKEVMPFIKNIRLCDISYRYQSESKFVLTNINLSICKGARIGIIGKTGEGKSTILDVIMGLLVPSNGHLYIDDQKITCQNRRKWQAHIAHVPQTIFLADTTVAENIAFGVPRALIDLSRVKAAAVKSQLFDTISSMPSGYDTVVGERGIRLSGGQRQRIGIARALYKGADVLVFDEATSALDTETERAVMDVIYQLSIELTVIIVAHRMTSLSGCTQIIEIANGQVRQIGGYADISI